MIQYNPITTKDDSQTTITNQCARTRGKRKPASTEQRCTRVVQDCKAKGEISSVTTSSESYLMLCTNCNTVFVGATYPRCPKCNSDKERLPFTEKNMRRIVDGSYEKARLS